MKFLGVVLFYFNIYQAFHFHSRILNRNNHNNVIKQYANERNSEIKSSSSSNNQDKSNNKKSTNKSNNQNKVPLSKRTTKEQFESDNHVYITRSIDDKDRVPLTSFQTGQKVKGRIVTIVKHGLFIDIGTILFCISFDIYQLLQYIL